MLKNYRSLLFLILVIFSSCQQDEMNDLIANDSQSEAGLKIVGNRFKFSSKNNLSEEISKLKSLKENDLAEKIEEIQQGKVLSLRPIVTEKNCQRIANQYTSSNSNKYGYRSGRENLEEADFIGDDVFASLLNEDGELQVGDSVYKYTKYGVFFVHHKDLKHLNEYLASLLNSTNDSGNSSRNIQQDPCLSLPARNGITQIDQQISYYRLSPTCGGGGSGGGSGYGGGSTGGGSGSGSGGSTGSTNYDAGKAFIESLSPCSSSNGWLSFALGTSKHCYSYFTDKSRVKTKFWNQDYLVFKSIGVKVKHQFKGVFGIWYDADVDELRLGIREAYFVYTIPIDRSYLSGNAFIRNNKVYSPNSSTPIKTSGVPDFPFKADFIATVKLPYGQDKKLTGKSIDKTIWRNVWSQAKSLFKDLATDNSPNTALLIVEGDTKIAYYYVDYSRRETNVKRLEKVFDWNFLIKLTLKTRAQVNGGGIKAFGVEPGSIGTYNHATISTYGVARRGVRWRGSLLEVYDSK